MTPSTYFFTGPTISARDAARELDACYRPPARQGDVYRAALEAPAAIAIVDGYFETVPAVWHKEILWALSRGVHVYGSASMGALRAAELWTFGMIGVGRIFEEFRDGVLTDDDEVAIALGTADSGYRALSEAMVNIRATLQAAEKADIVSAPTRQALERIGKNLYYPDRRYPALLAVAAEEGIPTGELTRLRDWLPGGSIDQKRADAIAMLRLVNEDRRGRLRTPARPTFQFEHTTLWEAATRSITRA